ncbi:MAG: PhzF family phenazine biosynthesis protein [Anaerobacillus sp.]
MRENLFLINAFTKETFKGNPAMVVIVEGELSDIRMKRLAAEFNQPITTFVQLIGQTVNLRWFTPVQELPLCGHGTLSAAHVLWNEGYISMTKPITFVTKGGELKAEHTSDHIQLTFKVIDTEHINVTEELQNLLDVKVKAAAWAQDRYILELESEIDVVRGKPDFAKIKKMNSAGVVITSKGNERYDIVSRYFAPNIGVMEDSVTGSAHCALASYWHQKTGDTEWLAYQASERGGEIMMALNGVEVTLGGECVVLMKGKLS